MTYEELQQKILEKSGFRLICSVLPVEYTSEAVNFEKEIKGGTIKLMQHNDEGTLPHLHLIYKKKKCCPRLDEAKYFNHREYVDILDSGERKVFNQLMKTPFVEIDPDYNGDPSDTVWKVCCHDWNTHGKMDRKKVIDTSKEMPNYRNLTE